MLPTKDLGLPLPSVLMASQDTPPVLIALTLLRRPAWQVGSQPAVALSRKDAGLLALLALEGSCPRDVLAQMLWPEGDLVKARASLRQRRFRLARGAGLALIEGEATLQLAAGVDHDARDPDARLASDAAALQGELLEGLSFDDCPEYARWLDGARERWRVTRAQALGRLASRLQQQGSVRPAVQVAQRLCADEPLSEHAHRQLMELHYAHGDLGAALQVYRQLAERLDAELGELPDEETAALAARLRLGRAPARAAPGMVAGVPASLSRPPRLIGREAAWAALDDALERRMAVVMEGAPGMGKTRLLTDFVAGCQPGAALMVPARAGDAQRPYSLLVRLLLRLWLGADALRPGGQQALPEWARYELAALLPELGAGTHRTEALRLQRAVEVALQQANLALVALDDVQNSDAATLELLASWVGAGLPAWVLACRAGEVPAPVQTWMKTSGPPRAVVLQPFGAQEISALLRDLAPQWVALQGDEPRHWAERLQQHTGGLPLYVLETLRAMCEQPERELGQLPTPEGVAQVVLARRACLPEAARQLAHAAAVLRAPLTPEAGAALLGGQPAQWVQPQALLEAAHWVDARGLMHDVVSATLIQAMPAAERRWLHGNLARWLVQAGDSGQEVAAYFEAAGMLQEAAEQLEAAALRAGVASRPAEEAELWQRAAALWERAGRRERVFETLLRSLRPLKYASGNARARTVVEHLNVIALTRREQAAARVELGLVHAELECDTEAVVTLTQARDMALAANAEDIFVRAVIGRGFPLARLGQPDEALTSLVEIRPRLSQCGLREHRLYLNALFFAQFNLDRLEEAAATCRERMTLFEDCEDRRGAPFAASNLAYVLTFCGRLVAAREAADRAQRYLEELSSVHGDFIAHHAVNYAAVLAFTGDLGSALRVLHRCNADMKAPGSSVMRNDWLAHLAVSHLLRGDIPAAQIHLAQVREQDHDRDTDRARRRMIQAALAASRAQDPARWLQQARTIAAGSTRQALLDLEIDACAAGCGLGAANDSEALLALEQRARAIEQGGLATRLAWYRVDTMRRGGDAVAAAALARELLEQPLWPTMLLPCHWLWIAQAALEAAGDPQAPAVAVRAREAHAKTLADLGALSGPPAQWPGPMIAWHWPEVTAA
jgi:DNA-binding SARP family transcriptional activator/tetratricopeptide (TPR) repeat protein